MKVWVKECSGDFNLKMVSRWVRKGISVESLTERAEIAANDIVLYSANDKTVIKGQLPDNAVLFENVFQPLTVSATRELTYNFDLYYLQQALARAKQARTETIITGSSYCLFGIDPKQLSREVNLGMTSQDLYYALRGVYEVCAHNSNIKNVVLISGTYYLYSDLSKTRNESEILRVAKVYEPLFGDLHNCNLLAPRERHLSHSNFLDAERILEVFSEMEYERGYFNEERPRTNFQTGTWERNADWHDLSEQERWEAGKERAKMHNGNKKYVATFLENRQLLQEFLHFCGERGINAVVVIPPATKYYRAALDQTYKDELVAFLESAQGIVHLLDLYDSDAFEEQDFNDTDHLSDAGAGKLTQMIRNLVESISTSS